MSVEAFSEQFHKTVFVGNGLGALEIRVSAGLSNLPGGQLVRCCGGR
jgi:hypothetical protein